MTDKPIIIDGVDVTKCRFYKAGICILSYAFVEEGYNCIICEDCPNCYYKQLQRAKDECIRLGNERTADLVQQLQQEKAAHQVDHDKGQNEINRLCGELQRKTAECEKLKKAVMTLSQGLSIHSNKLQIATGVLKEIYDQADEIFSDGFRASLFCKQVRSLSLQALEQLGSEE